MKEGLSLYSDQVHQIYESFGFRFKGAHQEQVVGIHSIGKEIITSTSYDWNGAERSEVGRIVFQYTLSGKGMIYVKEKYHSLPSGQAFLVELPSEHRYFFPEDSEHWEFIHITLFGKEIQKAYQLITEQWGHVISFPLESEPIKWLTAIYEKAVEKKISDAFQASSLAYSFMMELYRYAKNIGTHNQKWPEPITKAALFAQKNYDQPIGLDELVEASGLSKYHFTRLFHKTTNTTPLQYLTKIRIDRAIEALQKTDLTIDEIARMVGYANGNYFSKVFSKRVGMSPGQFRDSKHAVPVDHIILD